VFQVETGNSEFESQAVKPGKLIAAARRELTANPKKAAALALLLAAAAWFWGPIVWRTFGGAKPPTTAQALVMSGEQQTATTTAEAPNNVPKASWSQLLAARRSDPHTQPAKFDPNWPQPFKVQALATASAGQPQHAQVVLTPAQAGLVLESIAYGSTKRAAMINGEIYREGSEVAIAAAAGAAVSFQVARIDRASVVLERYGRTYRLDFPRPSVQASKTTNHVLPAAPTTVDQP